MLIFGSDTSVQFALFKTYGIPTISSLLVATKEFSTAQNASKRYADTVSGIDIMLSLVGSFKVLKVCRGF